MKEEVREQAKVKPKEAMKPDLDWAEVRREVNEVIKALGWREVNEAVRAFDDAAKAELEWEETIAELESKPADDVDWEMIDNS